MRTKKSWTSVRPESPGQYWVRTVASEGVPVASRILWHDGRLVVFLNEPGQPSRWVPLDDAYPDETRAEFLGPVSP